MERNLKNFELDRLLCLTPVSRGIVSWPGQYRSFALETGKLISEV